MEVERLFLELNNATNFEISLILILSIFTFNLHSENDKQRLTHSSTYARTQHLHPRN
jgi:DNA-binding CsgD family transcriptional regulator